MGGTLLEGELRKATKVLLVVHEFRTPLTMDAKMEANASVLDRFLRLLLGRNGAVDENFQLDRGQLFGPISSSEHPVAGTRKMRCRIPFLIGKIRTDRIAFPERNSSGEHARRRDQGQLFCRAVAEVEDQTVNHSLAPQHLAG